MEGKPLIAPKEAEIKYQKAMVRLVERMVADYERALMREVRKREYALNSRISVGLGALFSKLGAKWSKAFRRVSRKLTNDMIGRVDRQSRTNLNESLRELSGGLTIKTAQMPKGMSEVIAAATVTNVELIKTIPQQFHDKIFGRVMTSVQQGAGGAQDVYSLLTTELQNELVELGGSTEKRAELIAKDQTAKITSAINAERMKSAGVTKFKWRHSGGGAEPRAMHQNYNGKIFDLNDPPIIEYRRGVPVRGLPGEAINCRCVAIPVIDFGED